MVFTPVPFKSLVSPVLQVLAHGPGGFVVETKVSNDAVKGDCYHVLVQVGGHRWKSFFLL